MSLYISPYKNYRQAIHKGIPKRHPITAEIIGWEIQPLAAAFGQLGDEQPVFNPLTGETVMVADIITGVYDTEVAQQTNGWSDLEREIVEKALDEVAATNPAYVRKLEPIHVPAPAPWQTYPQTASDKVVDFALELGLVPEALRFERENGNRDAVVAGLEAAMDPEDAGRAKPLEEIDVPVVKPSMRVGKAPKTTQSGIVAETPGLELKQPLPPDAPEPTPGRVNV